jgi:hypothetical protein
LERNQVEHDGLSAETISIRSILHVIGSADELSQKANGLSLASRLKKQQIATACGVMGYGEIASLENHVARLTFTEVAPRAVGQTFIRITVFASFGPCEREYKRMMSRRGYPSSLLTTVSFVNVGTRIQPTIDKRPLWHNPPSVRVAGVSLRPLGSLSYTRRS